VTETVLLPLAGGAIIGLAATVVLLFNGRIAGISGILGTTVETISKPTGWRLTFLLGLLCGGVVMAQIYPSAFPSYSLDTKALAILAAAGLLVGFGTRLGGGCTSGHGVCGISRLSARSIVATLTFIATGALTVLAVRAAGLY